MAFPYTFAEAAAHEQSQDLVSALGIDWQLLIIQIVAFLLLVALLGKFVYPWLMKSVDERQARIEEAQAASTEALKSAHKSQLDVEELLMRARKEAQEIVTTAKDEAAEIIANGEEKALQTAEKITEDAKAEIARDVEAVKKQLHNETLDLVALATEKIIGAVHTQKPDAQLIEKSLKEAAR